MTMLHSYSAYGLTIRSSFELPELVPGDGAPDVVIEPGAVPRMRHERGPGGSRFWASGDEMCHVVDEVGAFLVRGGREIVVDASPGVDSRLVRLSLLGPALGLLLHQRGRLTLHASAVETPDGAIAFVGASGAGKSTMAALLDARGHRLVTDDLAALDVDDGEPVAFSGFPQVKLWPDAVRALGDDPGELPRLHPGLDKRAYRVSRAFPPRALPVRRLYVLAREPGAGIATVSRADAMIELNRHLYGARFGLELLRIPGAARRRFDQCARLASRVPMRRVTCLRSGSSLLATARLVETDLTSAG
jgi:hypothetical protein